MCCSVEVEKTGELGPMVAEVEVDLEPEHYTFESQSRTIGGHRWDMVSRVGLSPWHLVSKTAEVSLALI